jgi:hypothetical protein
MISLTAKEKQCIISNRDVLKGVFEKYVADLKTQIIFMPQGIERDIAIGLTKSFLTWMSDITNLQLTESKKNDPIY